MSIENISSEQIKVVVVLVKPKIKDCEIDSLRERKKNGDFFFFFVGKNRGVEKGRKRWDGEGGG